MKVKELIKILKTVNSNNIVYIDYKDFNGFSVDDNNDLQLYPIAGDKDA